MRIHKVFDWMERNNKRVKIASSGSIPGARLDSPVSTFKETDPHPKVETNTEITQKNTTEIFVRAPTDNNNPIQSYHSVEEQFKKQIDYHAIWVDRPYDRRQVDCWEDYHEECARCQLKRENGSLCPMKLRKREDIRIGCNHLYRICRELGLKCIRVTWDTDDHGNWLGNFKGIDDWQAGKGNAADTPMTPGKAAERKCAQPMEVCAGSNDKRKCCISIDL